MIALNDELNLSKFKRQENTVVRCKKKKGFNTEKRKKFNQIRRSDNFSVGMMTKRNSLNNEDLLVKGLTTSVPRTSESFMNKSLEEGRNIMKAFCLTYNNNPKKGSFSLNAPINHKKHTSTSQPLVAEGSDTSMSSLTDSKAQLLPHMTVQANEPSFQEVDSK